METFTNFLSQLNPEVIATWLGYIIAFLSFVWHFFQSRKAGKNAAQSLLIAINTLKDENKLANGRFTHATIEKAEKVAEAIGANDVAFEQVKTALKGQEVDVKLGSYKGKPIYLSDALGAGGLIKNLKKIF